MDWFRGNGAHPCLSIAGSEFFLIRYGMNELQLGRSICRAGSCLAGSVAPNATAAPSDVPRGFASRVTAITTPTAAPSDVPRLLAEPLWQAHGRGSSFLLLKS